jgi:oxygen-dependent protoporphyrinogen oxidase
MPIDIHLESPVEEITAEGIATSQKFHPADLIISALPGLEISRITNIPLTLRNQELSVVNTGFHKSVLSKKGYGYLVPSSEQEKILGQIWDTCVFPVVGQTKLSSMVIGENAVETALDGLKRHLGIIETPAAIIYKKAWIPQYDLGHLSRIQAFEEAVASRYNGKLKLIGNYLYGASVESCLNRSKIITTNC